METGASDGESSSVYKGEEQYVIDKVRTSIACYAFVSQTRETEERGTVAEVSWVHRTGTGSLETEYTWKLLDRVLYLVLRSEDGGGRNRRRFERHCRYR